ncbi:hypothetical protein [Lacipirellula parvula]|uniref:YtkA-like domain-containing protein n=1 Tax=Lacipirellula parvula TaxID=2650471 RepID=A0A5K7XHI8_9BACT|nr:hypothetical protein [Lacipirellula parvula]BBO35855.1 hypothetical protein PLANPX_5467 [Lacipirellula parvula]
MSCRNAIRTLTFACCLAASTLANYAANADGGRLVHVERVDGFTISIFVAPDPPRVGPIDVSVLLQRGDDDAIADDAQVAVSMQQAGDATAFVSGPATREQATNKLLRSAWLELPAAGRWSGTVHCSIGERDFTVPFTIEVGESPPAWTAIAPWFLWPVAVIALFGVHRLLQRQRKNPRSDRSRPEGRLLQQ